MTDRSSYTDSFAQESAILKVFKDANLKNPKKVRSMATRLLKETTLPIQRQLLMDLIVAGNPLKYLHYCIDHVEQCAVIIKQFIDDGCHGMIMTGHKCRTIYPVKLDTRENWLKADDLWNEEDELLIQHNAAEMWMKEYDKGYFLGKVVLFPHFGFSGIPRVIEMQCSTDTEGMKRYPGTNYFVKNDDIPLEEHADVRAIKGHVEQINRLRSIKSRNGKV